MNVHTLFGPHLTAYRLLIGQYFCRVDLEALNFWNQQQQHSEIGSQSRNEERHQHQSRGQLDQIAYWVGIQTQKEIIQNVSIITPLRLGAADTSDAAATLVPPAHPVPAALAVEHQQTA